MHKLSEQSLRIIRLVFPDGTTFRSAGVVIGGSSEDSRVHRVGDNDMVVHLEPGEKARFWIDVEVPAAADDFEVGAPTPRQDAFRRITEHQQ